MSESDEEQTHGELRALADRALEALNSGNLEQLLAHADERVVFTAMNNDVAYGRTELRAYFEKMLKGPDAPVREFRTSLEVDRLTQLYGNDQGGTAAGTSRSFYRLKDGSCFNIDNRWTATVVKVDGEWKVATFHSSANLFDNPLLKLATKSSVWGAGAAAVAGFLLGLVWKRR